MAWNKKFLKVPEALALIDEFIAYCRDESIFYRSETIEYRLSLASNGGIHIKMFERDIDRGPHIYRGGSPNHNNLQLDIFKTGKTFFDSWCAWEKEEQKKARKAEAQRKRRNKKAKEAEERAEYERLKEKYGSQ